MDFTRRHIVQGAGLLLASPALSQTPPFLFENVIATAHSLSLRTFVEDSDTEPDELRSLDYDDYRKLRFRPEARISLGPDFALDLFHRGHVFKHRVGVNIVKDGRVVPIPYLPDQWDFGGHMIGPYPETLGFAGLRIRHPLNRPDVLDELIVFLGASYYRFLARGQRYGLSARGLAINAATPDVKEEFPVFKEFWIEEAAPGQMHLTLYALLNSHSITGAYSFTLRPGKSTSAEVRAVLFPRVDIGMAGIAPLTSMYLTGGSGSRLLDLMRLEVHDSDGLLLKREGRFAWRPLQNPRKSSVTGFEAGNSEGFGLLQRSRRFIDYNDLEAHYEMRPGYYVEPLHAWGGGTIQLSELVTESEIHDNIFAAFRPALPLRAGERSEWRYRITATGSCEKLTTLARVTRTMTSDLEPLRMGAPIGTRLFLIDFEGDALSYWRTAPEDIEVTVTASQGSARALPLIWNAHGQAMRVRVLAQVDPDATSEVTATLTHKSQILSETWLTHWRREPEAEEQAQGQNVR